MNRENLKSFNINSIVAVKLSESGKKQILEYYKNLGIQSENIKNCVKINGDVLEMQLWELMQIFGSAMVNGNEEPPFKSNNILISDTDLKSVKKTHKDKER